LPSEERNDEKNNAVSACAGDAAHPVQRPRPLLRLQGGQWYHIGVTWDDSVSRQIHDFFCVTDEALWRIDSHEGFDPKVRRTEPMGSCACRQGRLEDAVTGDGKVDIMDVIRLLKFVSGWQVNLG